MECADGSLGVGGSKRAVGAPFDAGPSERSSGADTPPSSRVRIAQRLEEEEPRRSPGRFLFELLAAIEDSRGTHSIAFMRDGGGLVGEVLTSGGQVRLVALADGQIPLGERLRQQNPAVAHSVARALRRARAEGRPLGEILIELGSVASDEIRAALLAQIADGLAAIARASSSTLAELTTPLSSRRLTSQLSSFPVAEIYWHAMAALAPPQDDPVGRCFQALAPLAGNAVLAARWLDRDDWLPIAVSGLPQHSLSDVAQLGHDLAHAASPTASWTAGSVPRLSLLKSGQGSEAEAKASVASDRHLLVLGGMDTATSMRVLGAARRLIATGTSTGTGAR